MKTKMRCFSCMLMFTLLTTIMYAQTPGKNQNQNTQRINLMAINSQISYYPRIVSWWDSGNGFICKVTLENMAYLIRFDKQGKYVETLIKKVWNETSTLQPSFQRSEYKLQKVISYWEVSDANKTGYYLEMNSSKNYPFSVWVDDEGNFSTIPSIRRIKTAIASK